MAICVTGGGPLRLIDQSGVIAWDSRTATRRRFTFPPAVGANGLIYAGSEGSLLDSRAVAFRVGFELAP